MKRRKPHPFDESAEASAPGGSGDALEAALNLGPKSTAWLAAIGIHTLREVRRIGTIEVCRRLSAAGQPVSILLAYALEGALTGTRWNQLTGTTKQSLRHQFDRMRKEPPPTAADPPP